MPSRWTFQIPPIAELLSRYVGDGIGWIDPFAGETSPAELTNDLNIDRPTKYHLDALDFIKQLDGEFHGVLFDPPYSLRQVKECYESVGRNFTQDDSQQVGRWTEMKREIASHIKPGGVSIYFGWDSKGMGKKNGFEIIEVLLICHGGAHNDTIVTVERKIANRLLA